MRKEIEIMKESISKLEWKEKEYERQRELKIKITPTLALYNYIFF